MVRPLIDKQECILLPALLMCGTPKGPHKFPSLVPMLELLSMPAIIVSFILHILRAVSLPSKKEVHASSESTPMEA